MKTNYQKPNTKIVMLKHQAHLLAGTTVQTLVNSEGLKLGKGSSTYSRSRSFDDWDDDEDF